MKWKVIGDVPTMNNLRLTITADTDIEAMNIARDTYHMQHIKDCVPRDKYQAKILEEQRREENIATMIKNERRASMKKRKGRGVRRKIN